jgi:hypothetical protein
MIKILTYSSILNILASFLQFEPLTGLVHEECVTKMRLMSLLDLSSCCSGEIPYSAIIDALKVIDHSSLPLSLAEASC